jgi:hypothetical protein
MPEFSEAGLRSFSALALAGVFAFVFCGGFDRFVPVLGPCPLMPWANAEPETATRTAAAVNTVFNFIRILPVEVVPHLLV